MKNLFAIAALLLIATPSFASVCIVATSQGVCGKVDLICDGKLTKSVSESETCNESKGTQVNGYSLLTVTRLINELNAKGYRVVGTTAEGLQEWTLQN